MCVRNTNCSDLQIDIISSIDDKIDKLEDIGFEKKIKKWFRGRKSR